MNGGQGAPAHRSGPAGPDGDWLDLVGEGGGLAARSRALLDTMHADDRRDALTLIEAIEGATQRQEREVLVDACAELRELLYFVDGSDGGAA